MRWFSLPFSLLFLIPSPPLAGTAVAQTVAEGYAAPVRALPAAANSVAVLPAGVVWFDGTDLVLDEAGQPLRSLLHFAAPRFGSFTLALPDGDLLFAESSFHELWRCSPTAGTARLLATVPLAYDAAVLGGLVLLSARTGGFSATTNDLLVLDPESGALTPIGLLPGASGPVAVTATGDLIAATAPLAFPPPPRSVEILRWPASKWALALAGGPVLLRANAELVANGIDSVGDLELDGDDDLLFVDWWNGRVVELSDVHAANATSILIDYATSALSPSTLQFVPATATAPAASEFEPFALAGGGTLHVLESDFATTTQLRQMRARPAMLSATPGGSIPVGAFTIDLVDGPANGPALYFLSTVRTGVLLPLSFPGFEQIVRWDAGLLFPVFSALAFADGQGHAVLTLNNPGFPGGVDVHAQVLFAAAAAPMLGASTVASMHLGP